MLLNFNNCVWVEFYLFKTDITEMQQIQSANEYHDKSRGNYSFEILRIKKKKIEKKDEENSEFFRDYFIL